MNELMNMSGAHLTGKEYSEQRGEQRVETLPVHELAHVLADPGLEHALELALPLRRGEQLVVLMATRHVHFNLLVGGAL